jgi:UDP-N-acetyl-D-galactosamine dehydrogenase
VAVSHKEYIKLDEGYFKSISAKNGILIDVKGIYRNKIKELSYWSL